MIAHSIPEVLSQARLEELLGKIREVRAGVLGDMALDAYWQVDMKRSRLVARDAALSQAGGRRVLLAGGGR